MDLLKKWKICLMKCKVKMRVRFRKEQDMAKKKGTGVSPITNRIYYGTQDTEKHMWVGQKTDITDNAIASVFEWFMGNMEGKEEYSITYPEADFELVMRRKS